MPKKLSTKDFITKANEVHGNKFDYSKVLYKTNRTKVIITCPVHGDFEQTPTNHLSGKGCRKCGRDKCDISRIKWTYEACKSESKKYKSRGEFCKGNGSAYQVCLKNKWLNDFFPKK